MSRVDLNSKLIEAASYEEEARHMRLYLTNGQMRDYVDVPRNVFEELVGARSAGHYYMDHIRGRFRHPE
jgi:hypothetical protein